MSFFSALFGRAPALEGPRQSSGAVRDALLAINRPSAPFVVRRGVEEGADLIAEWRIADAGWCEIFAKAHLEKSFKVLMRFDEAAHEVRAADQEWSVEWRAGLPKLSVSGSGFRGQKVEIEFGKAYGFTEKLGIGEIYNYRFTTGELKQPLQKAISASGWRWRPVAFGKL